MYGRDERTRVATLIAPRCAEPLKACNVGKTERYTKIPPFTQGGIQVRVVPVLTNHRLSDTIHRTLLVPIITFSYLTLF